MQESGKSLKISEEFGLSSEVEAAEEYASLNRDVMSVNYPLIADEVLARISPLAGILDIGTGTGALAIAFAERARKSFVRGVDFSSSMLKEAENNAAANRVSNIEFILADAHTLSFPDDSFDVVVSFGVLHHLHNLKQALGEIKRVLKKGRCAFLYDLRKDAPPSVVSEIAQVMNARQRQGFLASVKEAVSVQYLEDILKNMGLEEYRISVPSYSRRVIFKNREVIRKGHLLGARFNKVLMEVYFKK